MKKEFYEFVTQSLPLEKLDGANFLITGANGLIASSLAELLYKIMSDEKIDMDLYLLCRNKERGEKRFSDMLCDEKVHLIAQDVIEPLPDSINFNYIVHAASSAYPGAFNTVPVDVMKANFFGTYNMLEYARQHEDVRVVFVSSSEIYGENFDGVEIFKEDTLGKVDPAKFRACYPESKRASETLCMSYNKQYGTDIVAVRPAYIYGKNVVEDNTRADVYFLRQVMNGEDIVMYSPGEQVRSYCYVDDCVSGILFVALLGETAEVYNIGDPECIITLHDYAQLLADIGGVKLIFDPKTEPERTVFLKTTRCILDVEKLKGLGWKTFYNLEEGVRDIIEG